MTEDCVHEAPRPLVVAPRPWRLRIERGGAGDFASVRSALASIGGEVTVIGGVVEEGRRTDELLVHLAIPVDAPLLEVALRQVATVCDLRPASLC